MPNITDSDANKRGGANIIFRQHVDCPECDATVADVEFDSGATDEDGLADLMPGDLTRDIACPSCGHAFQAEYSGWMNYGDA